MKQGSSFLLIVESSQILAAGVRALLQRHSMVGSIQCAAGITEMHALLSQHPNGGLLLIDEEFLLNNRGSLIEQVARLYPSISILILCDRADRATIFGYLAAGAHGSIEKAAPKSELDRAVSAVLAGRIFLPAAFQEMKSVAPTLPIPAIQSSTLTNRQNEIMQLVASGNSNKEIARALGISEATVKVHLAIVFKRMGVHNRTSAAIQIQS